MTALAHPFPLGVALPGRAATATGPCEAPGTKRRPPSPKREQAPPVRCPLWGTTSEPPDEGSSIRAGRNGLRRPDWGTARAGCVVPGRADAESPGPQAAPKAGRQDVRTAEPGKPVVLPAGWVPTPRGEGTGRRAEDAGGSERHHATWWTVVVLRH